MSNLSEEAIQLMYEQDYDHDLNRYLEEGINYGANTIKNADQDDLEQLASDSFHEGFMCACRIIKAIELRKNK